MGSHKRQMRSDGCCCSPGRCAALLELFAGILQLLSGLFIRDWKVINLESSQWLCFSSHSGMKVPEVLGKGAQSRVITF